MADKSVSFSSMQYLWAIEDRYKADHFDSQYYLGQRCFVNTIIEPVKFVRSTMIESDRACSRDLSRLRDGAKRVRGRALGEITDL